MRRVFSNEAKVSELLRLLSSTFDKSQVLTSAASLQHYGTGESYHETFPPNAVLFPKNETDIVEAVKIAQSCQMPIVPWGAGTSLEGHVSCLFGGLTIDMSRHMNQLIDLQPEDMHCTVQSGMHRVELNDHHLKQTGLFFPVDPGADATLGGMTATRASGTNAVKYGTMKENVLACRFVTDKGRVVKTGTTTRKSSAGYDLTPLLVGSEGTLGVITEVSLRLHPIAEDVQTIKCTFESTEHAVNVVVQALQMNIDLAKAEFLDETTIQAVNQFNGSDDALKPTLWMELHGSKPSVDHDIALLAEIISAEASNEIHFARTEEERQRLWKTRHSAYYACLASRKGSKGWVTDVCVPRSRLAYCILETQRDMMGHGVKFPLFGHIGDGNFHVIMLYNKQTDSKEYLETLETLNRNLIERSLKVGGTCTGEHGVGYGKSKYLLKEHGLETMTQMQMVKHAFDPMNTFNPGKIFLPLG